MLRQSDVNNAKIIFDRIRDNVSTVIIGKEEAISLVILALISKGHVLLEDLPGTGKTTLVSSLARSIDCDFKRIQFTPDIMPSDVSGFSIFNQKTMDFEFRPGGVMSNLVLADEINRASAKTQSALLEAMEERQVTVDAKTYKLEEPFMVLATQNPIEQYGTYPLPEAQIDRFLIKLSLGYPEFDQEVEAIMLGNKAKDALAAVATKQDILDLRICADEVYMSKIVYDYIVEIVTATRSNTEIQIGSSIRGGLALSALAHAYALSQGRNYVLPDDVKYLVPFALGHRIALSHEAKVASRSPQDVLASIVSSIAVPYISDEELRGLKPAQQGSSSGSSGAARSAGGAGTAGASGAARSAGGAGAAGAARSAGAAGSAGASGAARSNTQTSGKAVGQTERQTAKQAVEQAADTRSGNKSSVDPAGQQGGMDIAQAARQAAKRD